MKRLIRNTLAAATIATAGFQAIPDAQACGGSRGRSYGGYAAPAPYYRSAPSSYGYARPSYPQPYAQPNYAQPAQPAHTQQVPAQVPAQRLQQAAPSQATVSAMRPAPTSVRPVSATVPTNQTAQQVRTQQVVRQAAATTPAKPVATQPAVKQSAPTQATPDAESSALAALASLLTQAEEPATAPANAPASNTATDNTAVPQFTPAAQTASHVGNWKAVLPSKVVIELVLNDGGKFAWLVRGKDKTTQFSGQYRITDGRLTLVRSNDLQQMAGSWKQSDKGFTFQLDGANNGGLEFQKA